MNYAVQSSGLIARPNLPATLKDYFGGDASDYSMSMTNDQMCLVDKDLNAIEEACLRREFFSTHGGNRSPIHAT